MSIDFIQGLVYVTGCETSIEVPVAVQRSMHIAQSPARMVDLVHEYWVPMDRPTDLGRMIASLREGKADVTDKKSGSKYRVYFATQEPAQERNRQPRNRPVRNLWGEEDVPPTWYGNILVVKYLYDDLADTMGPNDRVIVDRVVKRYVFFTKEKYQIFSSNP